ncbi:DegT/DnrJ/EryC1/StrS family aminotransferase [Pseudofulvimonas gallinarii]|nr:DegT/DnrJ/EryC1/StrS family aminotransferase [Pseudofulvimonas gallinarii]
MISLNDLKRAADQDAIIIAVAARQVIESGWYVLGPSVADFESRFAGFCGVDFATGVGNGTDALEIAMRALGLGPGDGVAMVANAGMYAATAAVAAGCTPVYCDINPGTLLMDPDSLATLSGETVRAVVVTHLYGLLADMPAILNVARSRGWAVIEDCAQAHGAQRDGKRAGSWGDLAAFSFYPTKNLGACGDGGAVVGADKTLMDRARSLRQYGWRGKYYAVEPGGRNSRLDELQAAILLAKLPALDQQNARRRAIASYYRGVPHSGLVFQDDEGEAHVHHLCVLRSNHREAFQAHLASHGVASDIHYPCPDHRQPVWNGRFNGVRLPVTERVCQEVVTIPCHPWMDDGEVEQVADAIRAWSP